MSKDFVQIADDVISGVKLLREGAPEPMKGFGALAMAATASKAACVSSIAEISPAPTARAALAQVRVLKSRPISPATPWGLRSSRGSTPGRWRVIPREAETAAEHPRG